VSVIREEIRGEVVFSRRRRETRRMSPSLL